MQVARVRALVATFVVLLVVLIPSQTAWATWQIRVRPTSGPGGTTVSIRGSGFPVSSRCDVVSLTFTDAGGIATTWLGATLQPDGTFKVVRVIPAGAAIGDGSIVAIDEAFLSGRCRPDLDRASTTFTVTAMT
jgi:hypothetical protein